MAQIPADFVTLRPWREIAAELAAEASPERVLELSQELDEALEIQSTPSKQKPG